MTESSKSKFFKDPQNVIALGVTFISLCALIVSVIQTRVLHEERELLRENSRASVWPRLELGMTIAHDTVDGSIKQFKLNLSNNGVGPAIITDVKMSYRGQAATNWWSLFKIEEIPDSIETYITNRVFNKRIVKPGETLEFLDLSDNLPLANAFYDRIDDLSMEIYYESIYKEKWKYDMESTVKLEDFEGIPEEEQFN